MRSAPASKPVTASPRSSTPSALARSTSASTSAGFSIICANGSPGATSPPNVRYVGRMTSGNLESVTTMSRIGCAPSATLSQTPMVSNKRRAAAAIAEARASPAWLLPSAGSATVTLNGSPSPWRSAMASARPAKPPPPISTSVRATSSDRFVFAMAEVYHWAGNKVPPCPPSLPPTFSPFSTSNNSR